jgi:alpha/beta superfamily hydrolase
VARRIESYLLDGPAGKLEALVEEPEDGAPVETCVLCHPDPLFGGTMHNKVVYRIARAFRRRGVVVLRFNFRGVGRSEGKHDDGAGEIHDARAALDWLRARYPHLPYSLAGFSFGSRVIMNLGCALGDARRLIAVGFPTRAGATAYLAACTTPKFFITSTQDEYASRAEMEKLYAGISEPKHMIWIEAGSHFFEGALDHLEETVFALG